MTFFFFSSRNREEEEEKISLLRHQLSNLQATHIGIFDLNVTEIESIHSNHQLWMCQCQFNEQIAMCFSFIRTSSVGFKYESASELFNVVEKTKQRGS